MLELSSRLQLIKHVEILINFYESEGNVLSLKR